MRNKKEQLPVCRQPTHYFYSEAIFFVRTFTTKTFLCLLFHLKKIRFYFVITDVIYSKNCINLK